jgi:amino-acid N-acetyltransferase
VAGVELYGSAALLRSVCVVDSAAGAGLGARLCDAAEAHARAAGASEMYLLTTTAAGYFARRGYRPVDRASAPAAIASSAQFRDLCPASAVFMLRAL